MTSAASSSSPPVPARHSWCHLHTRAYHASRPSMLPGSAHQLHHLLHQPVALLGELQTLFSMLQPQCQLANELVLQWELVLREQTLNQANSPLNMARHTNLETARDPLVKINQCRIELFLLGQLFLGLNVDAHHCSVWRSSLVVGEVLVSPSAHNGALPRTARRSARASNAVANPFNRSAKPRSSPTVIGSARPASASKCRRT